MPVNIFMIVLTNNGQEQVSVPGYKDEDGYLSFAEGAKDILKPFCNTEGELEYCVTHTEEVPC